MNKVILMGRLTRDPEVRYSQGAQPTAVCRYSLAVNRSYRREGEPDADFINVVAFGGRGEFAGKYFRKGMMVAVVGELRISSYDDKDGNRRWSTDVVVTEQHFAESRASFEGRNQGQNPDFAPAPPAGSYGGDYGSGGGYAPQPQAPSYNNAPPAYKQAPQRRSDQDGFMPIEDEIEGDEDLPF